MTKHIHIHLPSRTATVKDAGWDEAKHKRDHGKFSSTGGSSGTPAATPTKKTPAELKAHMAKFGQMLGGALQAQADRPGGAPGASFQGKGEPSSLEKAAKERGGYGTAIANSPIVNPTASKAGAGTQTHHSMIKPGDSLHDHRGQKIDHVESIGKAMHGAERTIHTRAGYQLQTKGGHLPDGMHAKASSYTEKDPDDELVSVKQGGGPEKTHAIPKPPAGVPGGPVKGRGPVDLGAPRTDRQAMLREMGSPRYSGASKK